MHVSDVHVVSLWFAHRTNMTVAEITPAVSLEGSQTKPQMKTYIAGSERFLVDRTRAGWN